MSLFIASLAFEQGGFTNVGLERLGIVVGSLLAGISGYVVVCVVLDNVRLRS
jgi:Na+:H+ antiporter, NhaA family